MKFKSSLAILSCTAIALSISVPSIAHTQDIDLPSKSTITRTKQLQTNNGRKSTGLVGVWKAIVNQNGISTDIVCDFRVDGIEDCSYTNSEGTRKSQGTWNYADEKLYFSYEYGDVNYSVQWISQDEFVLRPLTSENGIQAEQRFYRQQQAVQTSQQNGQGDKYGAIAVHNYGSYWGAAWNHSNPEAASNAALKSCFEGSRGKCKTAITFKNGCAALATSFTSYGTGAGVDKLSAELNAAERCPRDSCRVKAVYCND